jgi:ribosome-binding factor A
MDHRTERIAEALREELAELIEYEMSDPRVTGIIVTDVQISPDKHHAHVRLAFGPDTDSKEGIKALEHARNFLRRELGQRLEMYRIPDLRFEPDVGGNLAGRLEQLLKRIRKGRPKDLEPTEKTSGE